MGLYRFMKAVAATGSFSEAYLVRVTGTSIEDYQMRTEVTRPGSDQKGPRRIVIHEGRGHAAERDTWGGRNRQDIRDSARRDDGKTIETDWRRGYGVAKQDNPRGWIPGPL